MDSNSPLPSSLVLVGAGKMGGALLDGWIKVGLSPHAIRVVDPLPSEDLCHLCRERGIVLNPLDPAPPPEVLVLAVKPQSLDEVGPLVAPFVGRGTLLISILAGKTIRDLTARIKGARAVVRAMPNLPASIGRGATGAAASADVNEAQKRTAHTLLSSVGAVEWLDTENLINAVTAVSGSGPAYVFHLVECLAKAGAAAGLPPDVATRLARATVAGSGELLGASDLAACTLRQNVTSPGGTTAAALDVLMGEGRLEAILTEAVAAAKRRAAELSG